MSRRILITGGAGFIGQHVAKKLITRGYNVRLLDSLLEQVHGSARIPKLDGAELQIGDVRDESSVEKALDGVEAVVHLAAEVGVGQSMYEIDRYVSVNDLGTAILFQKLIQKPVRRIVTASSMSIYGEGLYRTGSGRFVESAERSSAKMAGWNPVDPRTGEPLQPVPTPEWKRPNLASVYALTKYTQERLTLNVASAYGMDGVALRLFNVYGPGQALSNPYTGVLAIFAARLMNGKPPLLYEDGLQRRDFVHVSDVANAFVAALEHKEAAGHVFNIGSGQSRTVLEIGELIARAMGRSDIAPEVTGKGRSGDIRHCFADVTKASDVLGFVARQDFSQGLEELAEWVAHQQAVDRVQDARRELEIRGLVA